MESGTNQSKQIGTEDSELKTDQKNQKESIYQGDWFINEIIGDFHSTEEPIKLIVNGNTLELALTFEVTEDNMFLFTIYLFDPEIAFKGQLTVILHNQINPVKSITKESFIQFTPEEYDLQPIFFDLVKDQLSSPSNGWITYDKDTNEIKSYLHFTIILKPTEYFINRFSQFKIDTEKKLFENYPISLSPNDFKAYQADFSFYKEMYNFYKPYKSSVFHFGGCIVQCIVNFPNKTFTVNIIDTLFDEGDAKIAIFITNYLLNNDVPVKKKIHYTKANRTFELQLPFSISEIFDLSKGWMNPDSLQISLFVLTQNLNVTCLYPIKLDNHSMNDGFYGIKYFIPLSLFCSQQMSPIGSQNTICFNPFYTNSLAVTPKIEFYLSDCYDINWDNYKLKSTPSFQFNYFKENVVFDISVTFVNKDKEKNISASFSGVSQSSIKLTDFNLNENIKKSGFCLVHDTKDVIEMNVKIHIYNDNYAELDKIKEREIIIDLCKDNYDVNHSCFFSAMAMDENFDFSKNMNEEDNDIKLTKNEPHNSSKTETGYVGLSNQGATCYLNSYLQTLFHLPAFRRLIYDMPTTGNEDPNISIPLNIQRLFYQLQFDDKPCSTVNLTKSFGWDSNDAFQQHDIEEFSRILIDNLGKKMKGTNLQDSIAHLFRGSFRSYIKCKNVDYSSYKKENFYDISLDVKGIPNLSESFKAYIKQEELTGDNQYKTNNFGKQDAILGTEFLEFPPILHIHLRRFMFDMDNFEGMIKINDRFEFPETIDLTEYLVQDSPQKSKSNIYDLYGVLVHSGGYFGGHYYAFLRTSTDPQWYKFNDSIVSKESVQKAVYDNYGSKERFYSAYMLIYIRRNDAQLLYEPISDDSVPEHLKMYKESTQIKENEIKVYFMHESCLKSNVADKVLGFFPKIKEGCQFVSDDRIHMEKYDRSTTTSELYAMLGSLYWMDEEDFRLWICYYQKVPRKVIISSDSSTLEDLTKGRNQLYVLFQPKKEDDMFDFKKECMIYINFFFSENLLKCQAIDDESLLKKQLAAPLQYLISLPVLQNATISSIIPLVNKKLGFNESAKLDCYQVPLNNNLQKLSDDSNLKEYGIGNGSILIFQMKQESINQIKQGSLKIDSDFQSPTENSIENNLTSSLNCFSEIDFNDDIKPSKSIENYFVKYFVVEVYNYKELTVPLFNIQLSYSISGSNAKKYIFEAALKNKNIDENVDEKTVTFLYLIANKFNEINDSDRMYEKQYKVFFSIPSFDTKQAEIKVQFSPDSKTVSFEKTISLKDCKCYDDVFNAFKSSCSKEEEGQVKELLNENNSFRFLIIQNERIEKVLSDYDYLGDLKPDEKMRIEVVPKNQLNTEMYFLLKTFYSNAEFSKSMAFLFDIKIDEKFSETKKRLTDYLNIQEGETLDNLNFYLKIANKSFLSLIIEDENTVKDRNGSNSKIGDVHDYSIFSLNNAEIVQLDDSSVLSVFSCHGSFMLQLEIVSNKYDETKMKKIPLSSLKTNLSTRHHTDLRIYN